MLPSPGWLLFGLVLFVEVAIVGLLIMPMPSNAVRGQILEVLLKAWQKKEVQYVCWGIVALCSLYCYDAWATVAIAPTYMFTCEQLLGLVMTERVAWATGSCVFLFLTFRRILDIQQQLYVLRAQAKAQEQGHTYAPPIENKKVI